MNLTGIMGKGKYREDVGEKYIYIYTFIYVVEYTVFLRETGQLKRKEREQEDGKENWYIDKIESKV